MSNELLDLSTPGILEPLKIIPHATKPIDIVLRRTAGAGDPPLCPSVMMLFSR